MSVIRFLCGESGRTFDRFSEQFKLWTDNEPNLPTLTQNALDPGSIGEPQSVGGKFARLADQRISLESILVKNLLARFDEPASEAGQSIQTDALKQTARESSIPPATEGIRRTARAFRAIGHNSSSCYVTGPKSNARATTRCTNFNASKPPATVNSSPRQRWLTLT